MPKSDKPVVIERIFNELYDLSNSSLRRSVVTLVDVTEAIEWCKVHHKVTLSSKNPANFIKDLIRGKGANGMWPAKLKQMRYTARQVTGSGNVFEFIKFRPGQIEPFEDRFGWNEDVPRHKMQTVSIPEASKKLGRKDETYLIQVVLKLLIVETHFALFSPLKVIEVSHLQIGLKLRLCEVDSIYSAIANLDGKEAQLIIITAEAKAQKQRILEEQIIQQFKAAFEETEAQFVVPIAMTAFKASNGDRGVYLIEFEGVYRSKIEEFQELKLQKEVAYVLEPAVQGI